MFLTDLLTVDDSVDWLNPINTEHPLNAGLIAEYAFVEGLNGIRNLTGMTGPATPLTSGYVIGTCEYLPIPIHAVRTGYSASTFLSFNGIASKITTAGTFSAIVRKRYPTPVSYIGSWTLGNSGVSSLYPFVNGTVYDDSFGTTRIEFVPTIDHSKWHHLIITADTTSRRYYQNGKLIASGSPGTFGINSSPTMGDPTNNRPFEGDIACICFYNRTFNNDEAARLYNEVRAGNPGRWNRLAKSVSFAVSAFSSTGGLSTGSTALTGSGTFAKPTYSATGSLNLANATLSAEATRSLPVTYATGTLLSNSAVLTSAGTFTKPTYSGTGSLVSGSVQLGGYAAALGPPTRTATAACTSQSATLAASATFVKPTYTGSASLTAGQTALHADATLRTEFDVSGSGNLAVNKAQLSGLATFHPPVILRRGHQLRPGSRGVNQ